MIFNLRKPNNICIDNNFRINVDIDYIVGTIRVCAYYIINFVKKNLF